MVSVSAATAAFSASLTLVSSFPSSLFFADVAADALWNRSTATDGPREEAIIVL